MVRFTKPKERIVSVLTTSEMVRVFCHSERLTISSRDHLYRNVSRSREDGSSGTHQTPVCKSNPGIPLLSERSFVNVRSTLVFLFRVLLGFISDCPFSFTASWPLLRSRLLSRGVFPYRWPSVFRKRSVVLLIKERRVWTHIPHHLMPSFHPPLVWNPEVYFGVPHSWNRVTCYTSVPTRNLLDSNYF